MQSLDFRSDDYEEVTEEQVSTILQLLRQRRSPLRPIISPNSPVRRGGGRPKTPQEEVVARLKAVGLWPPPEGVDLLEELTKREAAKTEAMTELLKSLTTEETTEETTNG